MNQFETISSIIKDRRTIKPMNMNGEIIDDNVITQLIELADWAPTHGKTEPWRFYVYRGSAKTQFCKDHAAMFAQANPEKASPETLHKLEHMGDLASHIIIAVMKRGNLPKIPALEEVAATAAAIQNLLLGAQALGLAAYWGSGGSILKAEMKNYLSLNEDDIVMGALYLGYTNQVAKPGVRNTPLSEKIIWQ